MARSRAFNFAEQLRDLFTQTTGKAVNKASQQHANTATVATKANTSSFSTFGFSLVDDANASAARSTLGLGTAATSATGDFATAAQGTKAVQALADAAAANTRAEGARTLAVSVNTSLNAYKANTNPRFDLYLPLTGGTFSGNVGIGTTTLAQAGLHIKQEDAGVGIIIEDTVGNDQKTFMGYDGFNDFQIDVDTGNAQSGSDLTIALDGTTKFRATNAGQFAFGTSSVNSNHDFTFQGVNSTNAAFFDIRNGAGTQSLRIGVPRLPANKMAEIMSSTGGAAGGAGYLFRVNVQSTDKDEIDILKLQHDGVVNAAVHFSENGERLASNTYVQRYITVANATSDFVAASQGTLDAYRETSTSASVGTATYTVNCNTTNTFKLTMTGNPTIAFSNVPSSGTVFSLTLVLVQDGSGNRTVTFPSAVKFAGGSAPTLSTGANDVDIITLFTMDGGTNWYGSTAGLDFS